MVVVTAGTLPAAESLEERLLADAADGRLNRYDLVSAALVASGETSETRLAEARRRYLAARSAILYRVAHRPTAELPAALHAELHARILVGSYQAEASDLRTALARGNFNCLSALVLYYDLCQAVELPVEIWLAPGHVHLRLASDSARAIEPSARVFVGAPGRGALPVAAGVVRRSPISSARQLTPVQLLGKFYYNRGVAALAARHYAVGLAQLRTSLALDPADADAKQNLAAGLNNWAIEEFRARRYQEAARLIRQGLEVAPTFGPLVANQRLVQSQTGVSSSQAARSPADPALLKGAPGRYTASP